VAIAIADQHVLLKKQAEHEQSEKEWVRKAELAVEKGQDDLARAALERSMTARGLAASFAEQVTDQAAQVDNLKTALRKLDLKLAEAQNKSEVLMAQHRRARALGKASDARMEMGNGAPAAAFDRLKDKVQKSEALSQAKSEMAGESVEDRLAALDKEDAVEKLLTEMKARKGK
jgi:phage shock protein A